MRHTIARLMRRAERPPVSAQLPSPYARARAFPLVTAPRTPAVLLVDRMEFGRWERARQRRRRWGLRAAWVARQGGDPGPYMNPGPYMVSGLGVA